MRSSSAASMSTWKRISSLMSSSGRGARRRARDHLMSGSGCAQYGFDGAGKCSPVRTLRSERGASILGQMIELGLSPLVRDAPGGRNEAAILEPIESGVERALLDLERSEEHTSELHH